MMKIPLILNFNCLRGQSPLKAFGSQYDNYHCFIGLDFRYLQGFLRLRMIMTILVKCFQMISLLTSRQIKLAQRQ